MGSILRSIGTLSLSILLAPPLTSSQTPSPVWPTDSPVGHWIVEHAPMFGALGTWWDFRADGTFTLYPTPRFHSAANSLLYFL